MINVQQKGDFSRIEKFLNKMKTRDAKALLERYGERGVSLLADATPKDSGKTAASWSYKIEMSSGRYNIVWTNSNVNKGVNIAMIIQYGHGTRRGGYVKGIDYINPATQKVFEEMAEELWKEVVSS